MPKTLAAEYKEAEKKTIEDYQHFAIRTHKVGTPVKGNVWDLAAEKARIEDGEDE